jgi:hypothetical protein
MNASFGFMRRMETARTLRKQLDSDPKGHEWSVCVGAERVTAKCTRCGWTVDRPNRFDFPDCDTCVVRNVQEE